jgi:8-amino-7-oxononanoate synthase
LASDSLELQLRAELDEWQRRGLRRETVLNGEIAGLDFGSNDYLGLARDSVVAEAMVAAVRDYGVGGRSARLLKGGSPLHEQCEAALAKWLGAEAALLFPSGYQANVGLITAVVRRGDAVLSDRDNHASLIDAARLSRAQIYVHEHCDLGDLERVLRAARGARRRLVLTEGVFSMAGDKAPLAEINELCRKHDAWLVVDEAHSVGLLGKNGAGAWAEAAVEGEHRLLARVVTCGKSLGVAGALVAGSVTLREQLIHKARSFLFTTAPPPALAGALLAAMERCQDSGDAREAVLANARRLARLLDLPKPAAAIVPVPIGDAGQAVALARELESNGFYAPAVRPPTVASGHSRLRLVCHAGHQADDIARLASCVAAALRRPWNNRASLHDDDAKAPTEASATCVVGTDTGVGKTVVSAILLRAACSVGAARYWKPVQTGADDDTQTVAVLSGAADAALLPNQLSFALPASPHAAAAAEDRSVSLHELQETLHKHRAGQPSSHVLVELAGGLLVPLSLEPLATQADWLTTMNAQIVLVARSGLGTLNHTMLTLEALRARGLQPAALFLVGELHASNRDTLGVLAGVDRIFEVPHWETLTTERIDAWLEGNDVARLFRV